MLLTGDLHLLALYITVSLRGHPHGNALLCKRTCFASSWPIVHKDPEITAPKTHFFETGSRGEKIPKHSHCPTPRPLASDL